MKNSQDKIPGFEDKIPSQQAEADDLTERRFDADGERALSEYRASLTPKPFEMPGKIAVEGANVDHSLEQRRQQRHGH